jgi:SAM-dependent methyltransferase
MTTTNSLDAIAPAFRLQDLEGQCENLVPALVLGPRTKLRELAPATCLVLTRGFTETTVPFSAEGILRSSKKGAVNAHQPANQQDDFLSHTRMNLMDLRDSWEAQASQWIQWARAPGHDTYWRFHRDQFLELLPSPGRRTVDIGCGEGRFTRELKGRGHQVIGIESSPSLVAAARESDPLMDIRLADAAALPLESASADLAVAFMSLHDVDAMPIAIREVARILEPAGKLCLAIVHPINSAGRFQQSSVAAPFVIEGEYLRAFRYADRVERDGLTMTFHSEHRPLEAYFRALEEGGLVVEALREPGVPEHAAVSEADRRWQRVPLFLHLRARRL